MLAVILARGGSKGLPNKNIRMLGDKPLIAWTIEAALSSKAISRVVVSTDSDEIADISKQYGAEIPFMRPGSLAGDESLAVDALFYTVDRLNSELNNKEKVSNSIDEVALLQPTSPFRTSHDIDIAAEIFLNNNADFVISCCSAEHPIEWYRCIDENGVLLPVSSKQFSSGNRQSFAQYYVPNGAIYISKYKKLKSEKSFYTEKTYPYLMSKSNSVDIDSLEDFRWAEFQIKMQYV